MSQNLRTDRRQMPVKMWYIAPLLLCSTIVFVALCLSASECILDAAILCTCMFRHLRPVCNPNVVSMYSIGNMQPLSMTIAADWLHSSTACRLITLLPCILKMGMSTRFQSETGGSHGAFCPVNQGVTLLETAPFSYCWNKAKKAANRRVG